MSTQPRDVYIPADSWRVIVDTAAPTPRGMDAFFVNALEQFKRYAATISGEIGDSIRGCQKHLDNFLKTTQTIVEEEAGEHPGRLGRLREFPYGTQVLSYQVFNYKSRDSLSIREDRIALLMTNYDLFHETMEYMEKTVHTGDLGIFKNSFLFIHKPLKQAADLVDDAISKMPVQRTAAYGVKADPNYVHIVGTEPCPDLAPGLVCRTLKPGYAFEGREIQEGVVFVAAGA
ncbi:MAG: hypothetical protein RBU29_01860 [bacterium]|jgi:hypothetical protein|nr:hypothetical protein [bacterium]